MSSAVEGMGKLEYPKVDSKGVVVVDNVQIRFRSCQRTFEYVQQIRRFPQFGSP